MKEAAHTAFLVKNPFIFLLTRPLAYVTIKAN